MPLHSGPRRIWATLSLIIQDGAAHKYTWRARGDGASKLCLLCQNLFSDASEICDSDGSALLRCNVLDEADLIASDDAGVRAVARYIEARFGVLAPSDFTRLQQAIGMTHAERSILLDLSLDAIVKPTSQLVHDWMHCLFADGIYNMVVFLLFEAVIDDGFTDIYEMVHDYVENGTGRRGSTPGRCTRSFQKSDGTSIERRSTSKARPVIYSHCTLCSHTSSKQFLFRLGVAYRTVMHS